MIDFSCREPNVEEIIRCSFALSRTEYKTLSILASNPKKSFVASELALRMSLERTGAQKALKSLLGKGLCLRKKCNLPDGGYTFCYSISNPAKVRAMAKKSVSDWSRKAFREIASW